jgi:hypothetical protein
MATIVSKLESNRYKIVDNNQVRCHCKKTDYRSKTPRQENQPHNLAHLVAQTHRRPLRNQKS